MQKIPVLVIFAPTASGKTALVGNLFSDNSKSKLAGKAEIINADSMQVYKGMDIGTAKPSKEFLKHLPHHLIDICSPNQQFGVGEFLPLADKLCQDIYNRGKLPVVCGGTAFYIRNFIYGLPKTPKADMALREKLQLRMKNEGAAVLKAELNKLDPESAARIHINDEYRILRALEVCYASGKSLSDFVLEDKCREGFDFLTIELVRPREELYNRINLRVDQMIQEGLEKEFCKLVAAGYHRQDGGMQAIGYREFFMAYDETCKNISEGNCEDTISNYTSSEEAISNQTIREPAISVEKLKSMYDINRVAELIKRDSRHYAKRQVTFFAPMKNVLRFPADNIEEIEQVILKFADSFDI